MKNGGIAQNQRELNAASPGDTIKVASGVFGESVEVTKVADDPRRWRGQHRAAAAGFAAEPYAGVPVPGPAGARGAQRVLHPRHDRPEHLPSDLADRRRPRQRVHGSNKNGEAGLYVGDSPQANAVVTGNEANNNENIGIFVRDSSGASSANPGTVPSGLC